jgi:hypothetical protein
MSISEVIKALETILEKHGDLRVSTGIQGTESFRDIDLDRDLYIYGIFGDMLGIVINEDAIKQTQQQMEVDSKKLKEWIKEHK